MISGYSHFRYFSYHYLYVKFHEKTVVKSSRHKMLIFNVNDLNKKKSIHALIPPRKTYVDLNEDEKQRLLSDFPKPELVTTSLFCLQREKIPFSMSMSSNFVIYLLLKSKVNL